MEDSQNKEDSRREQIDFCVSLLEKAVEIDSDPKRSRSSQKTLPPIIRRLKALRRRVSDDPDKIFQIIAQIKVVMDDLQTRLNILEKVREAIVASHGLSSEED